MMQIINPDTKGKREKEKGTKAKEKG